MCLASRPPDALIGVCVVQLDTPAAADDRLERMARFLLRHIRVSEAVVRSGPSQLVVLLPQTDSRGTEAVARRLQLAALLLGEFRRMAKASDTNPLTERERGVLQLVARGHTYKELAAELSISPKTAENHVRNILGKLHLSRRSDLVRYAVEHGLE